MASAHILLVGGGPGNQPDVLPLRARGGRRTARKCLFVWGFFVWRNRKQGMLQSWE